MGPDLVLRRMDSSPIPAAFAKPHRHELNEILIVQSGHGHHIVDGNRIEFQPSSICYLPRNHVHWLEPRSGMEGWLLQFRDDFLPADAVDGAWNCQAVLADLLDTRRALTVGPTEMGQVHRMMELMEQSYLSGSELRTQSLRHWLALLIITITEMGSPSPPAGGDRAGDVEVCRRFTALLEEEFSRHHDVGYYCVSLGISPVRLARAVGNVLGKPTKRVIDDRITLEAKRHLLYGDGSIKEIGSRLGYVDQFHFSKAFKRVIGQSPTAFREAARR